METDRIHVVPIGDLREHEDTAACWCHPTLDDDGVCIHNSLDRREHTLEKGNIQ
jgi:hypothetical protein